MSDKSHHDADTHSKNATTIHASKGGGGSKWLLGAAAAIVLLGGGYFAWQAMSPNQTAPDLAYNDYASPDEPLRAGALEPNQNLNAEDESVVAETAASDAAPAPRSTARSSPAPRRTTTASAASVVPEETIGIMPVNATSADLGDDIIVQAPRRPVWARTPNPRRLSTYYPQYALERGREGEASLHCTVQAGGALNCVRAEETPGFGTAALRVARAYRHAPTLPDGSDATGTPVNLRVVFRINDDQTHG